MKRGNLAVPAKYWILVMTVAWLAAPVANPAVGQIGKDEPEGGIGFLVQTAQKEYRPGQVVNVSMWVENRAQTELTIDSISWYGTLYGLGAASLPSGDAIDVAGGVARSGVRLEPIMKYRDTLLLASPLALPASGVCLVESNFSLWDQTVLGKVASYGNFVFAAESRHIARNAADSADRLVRGHQEFQIGPDARPREGDRANPTAPQCRPVVLPAALPLGADIAAADQAVGYDHGQFEGAFAGKWPEASLPLTWTYNPANKPAGLNGDFQAIENGMKAWRDDPASFFDTRALIESGESPANHVDGRNTVGWAHELPGNALAHAPSRSTPEPETLIEADVEIDRRDPWTTDPLPVAGRVDLQSVAAHELGHWMTLWDLPLPGDNTQTMRSGIAAADTSPRTLEWGDKSGVRYVYPNRYTGPAGNIGHDSQGSGLEAFDVDGNGIKDLVFAWVDDPPGSNSVFYQVGRDLSAATGELDRGLGPIKTAVAAPAVGDLTSGLGLGVGQFDANPAPDIFLAWVDNGQDPPADRVFYKIGFNVNANGDAAWGATKEMGGGNLGHSTQGLGVCVVTLTQPTPEVVVAWVDNPAGGNAIRYRIGFDLNANGDAAWGATKTPNLNLIGTETQGLGAACPNLDGSGGPDFVFTWMDNPAGPNRMRYAVGINPNALGDALAWTSTKEGPGTTLEWHGDETSGVGLASLDLDAELAVGKLVDELVFSWVDNPVGANAIIYREEWNGRYEQHP